jgi:hypothetical protein
MMGKPPIVNKAVSLCSRPVINRLAAAANDVIAKNTRSEARTDFGLKGQAI